MLCFSTDPMPGWSDNIYGLNGVIVGAAVGVLRVIRANKENIVDCIPADIVVDTILAAIYRVSQDSYVEKNNDGTLVKVIPETKIYNCVSFPENPIKWSE
jgi:alcohol-forming fatty acyl-CoA reductase